MKLAKLKLNSKGLFSTIYRIDYLLSFIFAFWAFFNLNYVQNFSFLKRFGVSFLLFFVFFYLFFVPYWFFMLITSTFVSMKKDYKKPSRFFNFIFNLGYGCLCRYANIRLKVTGLEKVPTDEKFLFVSNHLSKFDNMIFSPVMAKIPLAFVSKTSNFKMPMCRRYMKRACYLPLERSSLRSAVKMIDDASKLISNQFSSVALFPEGTRSKTGELQDFKPGCFKIALKAKCPIVVATICGTENIHKNFPFKKTEVQFDVLKVFPFESFSEKKTLEIRNEIHSLIDENIKEVRKSQKN